MRAVRRSLTALGAIALLAGSGTFSPAARADATEPTTAILHFRVTSTASWANMRFDPGAFPYAVITAVSPGASAHFISPGKGASLDGIALNSNSNQAVSADFLGIFVNRGGAAQMQLSIKKGMFGQVTAQVWRRAGTTETLVARFTDASTADGQTVETNIDRDQVFGATDAVIPRADSRRLVIADYYPWYKGRYDDPHMADQPTVDYDVNNPADVDAMTALARANGIDGFSVAFSGERDMAPFQLVLNAALAHGSIGTAYLTTPNAKLSPTDNRPSAYVVESWLRSILSLSNHPSFLRFQGVPVVFAYQMQALPTADWETIEADLANAGMPVKIIGEGGWSKIGPAAAGWHKYNPNFMSSSDLTGTYRYLAMQLRGPAAINPAIAPDLMVATVSPGFNDVKERGARHHPVVKRGKNGERYAETWAAALSADPDWVLITSWNEWYEGTSVQPSRSYGDLALRQTATYATQFTGRAANVGP